jgi:glutathione S-transferase
VKDNFYESGGGTPHKPPILDDKGYVIHESTACAQYLISKGLMPSMILKEVSSYDTVSATTLWNCFGMGSVMFSY